MQSIEAMWSKGFYKIGNMVSNKLSPIQIRKVCHVMVEIFSDLNKNLHLHHQQQIERDVVTIFQPQGVFSRHWFSSICGQRTTVTIHCLLVTQCINKSMEKEKVNKRPTGQCGSIRCIIVRLYFWKQNVHSNYLIKPILKRFLILIEKSRAEKKLLHTTNSETSKASCHFDNEWVHSDVSWWSGHI